MNDTASGVCAICKGKTVLTARLINGVIYCPHTAHPSDDNVNPYAGNSTRAATPPPKNTPHPARQRTLTERRRPTRLQQHCHTHQRSKRRTTSSPPDTHHATTELPTTDHYTPESTT